MPPLAPRTLLRSSMLALLLVLLRGGAAVARSDDDGCAKPGYIFLPGVEQERWEAIRNCVALPEPRIECTDNQDCVAFSSTGWTYRSPRATACPSGPAGLASLEFNWPWRWVPLQCKQSSPCCGSYVAVDRGANAPFQLTCASTSAPLPLGPSSKGDCYEGTCPRLDYTNFYERFSEYERDCCRRFPRASFCSDRGHRRSLAAAYAYGPEQGVRRKYQYELGKRKERTLSVGFAPLSAKAACASGKGSYACPLG